MKHLAISKTKIFVITVILVIAAAVIGIWTYVANSPSHKVQTVVNTQHQTTQINYHGQNGINALTLLKKHAKITVKHYSFGDFVTSINGTIGNGPKYWTFYVNGKESNIGASSYVTKNGDTLTWKLQ